MAKRIVCILLSLLLVTSLSVVAAAEEQTEAAKTQPRLLYIATAEQFLEFAENCRLDTYSRNLQVTLTNNIDLTGYDFAGVPTFSGIFLGRGHTISGMTIDADGSYMGLFRYLGESAVVRGLQVEGNLAPGGSRAYVGGIAGENSGRIEDCSFSGTVEGGDYTGGIAGSNTVTGIVSGCAANGTVNGSHFTGGVAGINYGVIRSCENQAEVNADARDNTIDISDITLDSITGAESAATTTDIGGIAGENVGVIRLCTNRADVGYRQMGYNIGGIAGSNVGLVAECENYASVFGRKEVGGIVGQMVPATKLQFSVDALQILEGQMDTLSGIAGAAGAHAQSVAAGVASQMNALQNHMDTAKDALTSLLPKDDPESVLPDVPDMDAITAAQNTLSESMKGMQTSANAITSGLQGTLSTLSKDMQAITGQVGQMGQTLKDAENNLGGSITDVSDLDTEEDTTGKVTQCANYGSILADLNAGGIAGAMALENELDQEDNLDVLGESSLNFAGQMRSVITGCRNHGIVTAKKQGVGGIVGRQAMGLVKDCANTGKLDAANAGYVGGIAGQSDAIIRNCSAKSELKGSSWTGGIAGSGNTVTDCRSMTLFHSVGEKTGEVLGGRSNAYNRDEAEVSGNLYLSIGSDRGAIDGISYADVAQPVERQAFARLENIHEMFKTVKVYFLLEDGQVHTVSVAPGGALDPADIPEIPEKAGHTARWEGLAEADLNFIEFDAVFPAVYTKQIDTLQSDVLRQDGKAVLLAQGKFVTETPVVLENLLEEYDPSLLEPSVVELWGVTAPEGSQIHTLRYCLPEGLGAEDIQLSVLDAVTGNYRSCQFTVNGSYIVFSGENVVAFSIMKAPVDYTLYYGIGGGVAALIVLAMILTAVKKKKSKTAPAETTEE